MFVKQEYCLAERDAHARLALCPVYLLWSPFCGVTTVFVSSMFTLSVTEADFTTKRRQSLWTSIQISESMSF